MNTDLACLHLVQWGTHVCALQPHRQPVLVNRP